MAMKIERITIDIVTNDCGVNYSALDSIYEWVEEHGMGQHIINSNVINLKLEEEK